jgi:hypothetical protein
MDERNNRRDVLGSVAASLTATATLQAVTAASAEGQASPDAGRVPGHEAIVVPPIGGPNESALITLADGSVGMSYGSDGVVRMQVSKDAGRSWSTRRALVTADGKDVTGSRTSPIRLKSARLGLLHTGGRMRPGRDGKLVFRVSQDEGLTWSEGVDVDPIFAVLRSDCGRVLQSGRIIAPVFIWISAYAGGESEAASHEFCFSWVYYSDDEGNTWNKSHSELFVANEQGRKGIFQFEEPVVEELKDGGLLMLGRTETGRHYVSFSNDQGVTWTPPVPGPVTAAYTPTLLRRILSTGDLLIIWNQTSPTEAAAGLERHRLSCAISKDEGASWGHFHNLESLDSIRYVEPPPAEPITVYRKLPYAQPTDRDRYPYAPGPMRVCYPSVAFVGKEVIVVYDVDDTTGYKLGGPCANRHATKLRVVPLDWLYS